jgi:hypothetical protein
VITITYHKLSFFPLFEHITNSDVKILIEESRQLSLGDTVLCYHRKIRHLITFSHCRYHRFARHLNIADNPRVKPARREING